MVLINTKSPSIIMLKEFKLAAKMKNLPYTDTGSMVESAPIMALLVMA